MNIFKKVSKSNRQEYLVDWLCSCFHTKFNQATRERLEGCPLGTVCIYPKDLSITPDPLMQAFIDLNEDIDVAYCQTLCRNFMNQKTCSGMGVKDS